MFLVGGPLKEPRAERASSTEGIERRIVLRLVGGPGEKNPPSLVRGGAGSFGPLVSAP